MRFARKFTEEERVKIVEEVLECGSNSSKRIHLAIDYRTPDEFYMLKNNNFKNKLVVKL